MKSSQLVRFSDYMADFLYKIGVRNVFMLSGMGSIHLDDALRIRRISNTSVLGMKQLQR